MIDAVPLAKNRSAVHENRLRAALTAGRVYRELDLHLLPYQERVLAYYLGESRHPDDVYYTIDKWNQI